MNKISAPTVVNILLVLMLAFVVASIIINTMRPKTQINIPEISSNAPTTSLTEKPFQTISLFGKAKKAIPQKKERVKANLNLELLGVIVLPNPKLSSAVISQNGNSKIYLSGDKIMNGVSLLEVRKRYIVVSHAGLEKTIDLKKNDLSLNTQLKPASPINIGISDSIPQAPLKADVSERIEKYKTQLQENPLSLMNLFVGQPVNRNRKPFGIKLSPGTDPELFKVLQLQPNDIIISVEGMAIMDANNMPKLIELLENTNFFAVSLERKGIIQTINISL